MTTGKPPQLPPKTLLGTPADVQAAVARLQAERQKQVAPGAAPAPAAGRARNPDLMRTQHGNPHATLATGASARPPAAGTLARPPGSAQPPALPVSRPPALPPRAQPALPAHVQPPAARNRTQYGAPTGLDAAVSQARAIAPASAAPRASAGFVQPMAARPAPGFVPPHANSAQPALRPNQTVIIQSASQPLAAQPAAMPSVPKPPAGPFVATEPDRDRDSNRPAPAKATAEPPNLRLSPNAPLKLPVAQAANPISATRLVTTGAGAPPAQIGAGGAPSLPSTTQYLSLSADEVSARKPHAVKRWPALSLFAIAFVAFGGVILVRAPGLLPQPLLAMGAFVSNQVQRLLSGTAPALPPAAGPQTEPPVPGPHDPAPQQPTPENVAPSRAPSAPAAVPLAPVRGGSAELEKQAIDLLMANDYAAARAVYELLRAAEPAHPEYGVMLDLLTREIAPACGSEGQMPCPQP
jgi:hypothetical protein